MKTDGRPEISAVSVDDRTIDNSPDQRDTNSYDTETQAIIRQIRAANPDTPPQPRPDPRSKITVDMGKGMTNGEFAQSLADQGWVNAHADDFKTQHNYTFFGEKNHFGVQESNPNAAEFLLDTFKRARSVGYPIHALTPYLDTMASSTFSDQGYEDK